MRVLVACPSCSRQLDASGLEPGQRFRCTCGEIVEVGKPRAHDAAVVRCSACGAPRNEGDAACRFCGSDFTLHEQDLHTLCPGCMARISDHARFCHHCATPILPQGEAGDLTELECPICGPGAHLTSRNLTPHALPVLECASCAGMWLGHDHLRQIVDRAKERATAWDPTPSARKPASATAFGVAPALAQPSAPFYRPCPKCQKLMIRKNWGGGSGVLVDVCAAHGVWFDADELAAIVAWVRDGGLRRERRRDELRERAAPRRSPAGQSGLAGSLPMSRVGDKRLWRSSSTGALLGGVIEIIARAAVDLLLD